MSATVKIYALTGSGPTRTSVDTTDAASFRFGRDDLVTSASTAPIPIPTSAGTDFSWRKTLVLRVTAGGGSTSLLNRFFKAASALPAGTAAYYIPMAAYVQNTGTAGTATGQFPADSSGADGAAPANNAGDGNYVALTTSNVSYDSSVVAATDNTDNGKYLTTVLGVSSNYAGGPGATVLPNVQVTYDEQ